ncbi:TonB-dependent receptor [Sphingomonas sp. URHD0057]|uniref:TonB-dependent receptor n=1 Tax=Sphingomonas sp. URHD0057 TaxID=1380389 RepID=UPI00048E06DF|nr:TonB-dependent receptor [Sphingomonas sp. URHD0057]
MRFEGEAVVGVLTLAMAAAVAQAAPPGPEAKTDSAIVVTGERARRSLKETASSVAVFDKRDIEAMAAPDRVQDVLAFVPNVLILNSRATPSIRGQASIGVLAGLPGFLGGARPRTVTQIDGRTVTFNEFANSSEGLWDVDHVEVFRCPQTTTQGVNSIGGAIFIHTAEPTYAFEGRGRVIAGGSRRRQVSAVLSGPLVGDQLAFRVSGDVYRARAAQELSGPVVGIGDLNRDRYWATRAKLLAEPRAVPGLKLLAIYAHNQSQAPQAEFGRAPFRDRRNNRYVIGYFKSDVDSVTTTATYPFTDAIESRTTLTWGRSRFRRFAPQGFGQTRIRGRDRSLETVFEWKAGGPLSGVAGGNLQNTDLNQFIDLSIAHLGTGSFKDRQRSAGAFGELTWRPSSRVSLTAGARYQSDGKRRIGVLRMTPDLPLDYNQRTHAILPKVSAAYDLSEDVRVGVLVQRAYNPGGVTLDPAHRAQLEFKPEYLWDYEAFTRASLFGGRVRIVGNLFYNAMRDAQREHDFDFNSPGGQVGLLQILSEPRARSYGAELELTARPTGRLTLTAAMGLLDTRITRTIDPNDPFLGKEFGGAPHFTGAAGVDWEPVRRFRIAAQLRHNSGFWGDDSEDPRFRTTGWTIVDARASWDARRFTMFAYAQNLFNKFHIVGLDGPLDGPDTQVDLTDPREVGLGLESRF